MSACVPHPHGRGASWACSASSFASVACSAPVASDRRATRPLRYQRTHARSISSPRSAAAPRARSSSARPFEVVKPDQKAPASIGAGCSNRARARGAPRSRRPARARPGVTRRSMSRLTHVGDRDGERAGSPARSACSSAARASAAPPPESAYEQAIWAPEAEDPRRPDVVTRGLGERLVQQLDDSGRRLCMSATSRRGRRRARRPAGPRRAAAREIAAACSALPARR